MADLLSQSPWTSDLDPYNHTRAGFLGTHRGMMLHNFLLAKPKLGQRTLPHLKGLPADFTFGNPHRDPFTAAHALHGWSGVPSVNPVSEVDNMKTCVRAKYTPNKLAMNRATIARGLVRADEFIDFKETHKVTLKTKKGGDGTLPFERAPPLIVNPGKAHGKSTKSELTVADVLSSQFQDKWIKDNYAAVKLAKMKAKKVEKKDYRFVSETKATQLRMHMQDTGVPQPLWGMPRFTNKAKPHLSTFRSAAALEAAHKGHQFDKTGRAGVAGQGINIKEKGGMWL